MLFLNIYIDLDYFVSTTHTNLIHNGKRWFDRINERQQETHGLLSKKSEFHVILHRGKWVHPENYNPTQLLDLCCSVLQLVTLDCGSTVAV